jgi:hypothetical protein
MPVVVTVVVANAVRQWLLPTTIYTLKLHRRGHVVPQGLDAWRGELRAADVMRALTPGAPDGGEPAITVAPDAPLHLIQREMLEAGARRARVVGPTGSVAGEIDERDIARVAAESARLAP